MLSPRLKRRGRTISFHGDVQNSSFTVTPTKDLLPNNIPKSPPLEVFRLLGCSAMFVGSYLLTFRDDLVPTTRLKQLKNMGPIDSHKTSVNNYQQTLRNISEERRSQPHCSGRLKSRTVHCLCSVLSVTVEEILQQG